MSNRDLPTVIDGFSSVQAIRKSGRSSAEPKYRHSRDVLPAVEAPPPKSAPSLPIASHIGHTVVPVRHEIVCYACGYYHVITGRIHQSYCPRCREHLNIDDQVIDGEWTGAFRTVGTVTLKTGGTLHQAEISAGNMVLEGNAEDSALKIFFRLDLCPGARFDIHRTVFKDLRVRTDAQFVIPDRMSCRHLEVSGDLKATVYSDGTTVIRSGGVLRGELHSRHLVIEEGGGLKARVFIEHTGTAGAA